MPSDQQGGRARYIYSPSTAGSVIMSEEMDRRSEKKDKKEKKEKKKLLDGAKSDDVESLGFSDIYGGSGLATAPARPMSVGGMNMMTAGGPGQGMGMQMPMTTGGMNKMGNNMAMNQNSANMAMADQLLWLFPADYGTKGSGWDIHSIGHGGAWILS